MLLNLPHGKCLSAKGFLNLGDFHCSMKIKRIFMILQSVSINQILQAALGHEKILF